jgi:hypothetical protein
MDQPHYRRRITGEVSAGFRRKLSKGIDQNCGRAGSNRRPLASLLSGAERVDNKAVRGVNADHVEPLVTDGGKAVRRR